MWQNVKCEKVEWDKTSNVKMSNGTKCRIVYNVEYRLGVIVSMFVTVVCCCWLIIIIIIRFYIINLEKMSNGKNVENHLDLPMSTYMCPCPCPCPSAHVHVHVNVSLSVSVSPWDTDTDRDTWTWTWADFSSKNFHEFIIHVYSNV
jgi:hypothetical protein